VSGARRAKAKPASIMVVTGSRAEFGLLAPVMRAIDRHPQLALQVAAAGSHLLGSQPTLAEVRASFPVAATVPMQRARSTRSRRADALAVARGIAGFTKVMDRLEPDAVLVLGDRIEAFAAATAAALRGVVVAHVHGGDRAEGIADESMRHAISKLAHVHFAASAQSAARLARMGEHAWRIHCSGSPGIDDLARIPALPSARWVQLGCPRVVILLHPAGLSERQEQRTALACLRMAMHVQPAAVRPGDLVGSPPRPLWLAPNADAGRETIVYVQRVAAGAGVVTACEHLPRAEFVGLLKRMARDCAAGRPAALIGNSSAGLIEASALGVLVINVGPRQAGRQRAGRMAEVPSIEGRGWQDAVRRIERWTSPGSQSGSRRPHPYGDGHAGERIAEALAGLRLDDPASVARLIRKQNAD
jgi:UDP-hydrolysing UDP-N-acetyl-D-glucosamine 2-epimerase